MAGSRALWSVAWHLVVILNVSVTVTMLTRLFPVAVDPWDGQHGDNKEYVFSVADLRVARCCPEDLRSHICARSGDLRTIGGDLRTTSAAIDHLC